MRGVFVSFDPVTRSGTIEADGQVHAFTRVNLPLALSPQVGDPVNILVDKRGINAIWAASRLEPGTFQVFSWAWFLFSPHGRVSLSQYWLRYWLPTRLAVGAYFVIGGSLGLSIASTPLNNALILAVAAVLVWVSLAVEVKRWHDRDKSWLWMLVNLVPLVGPLWAFVETGLLDGSEGTNQYGLPPLRV